MRTLADAIPLATIKLQHVSDTPRLDAEILIASALNRPRSFLYAYPDYILSDNDERLLFDYIEQRSSGEPIAYILGEKEFWSLNLTVSKDTLIPRPETEHLVEWVLSYLPETPLTIADLGTGSGAIAIALANERQQWSIHATDASLAALAIAIKNSNRLKLSNIEFYSGNWCEALPHHHYAAIISNPPYIAEDDAHLDALTFEPRQALCAKDDGLADFTTIIHQAKHYLLPGGLLVLEHGHHQSDQVQHFLKDAGFSEIDSHHDLAKKTRFIVGTYD